MSVYNDRSNLHPSIDSILNQSCQPDEILIIDDGSTDGSAGLIDEFANRDNRIRVIRQTNAGLTKALIRGCGEACGDYIVRQDADDISDSRRFSAQADVLDRDENVVFVSCWTDFIGPNYEFLETATRPSDPSEATHRLLEERLGPPAHGSVMFRRSVYDVVGGYRSEFYYGQDSDLWLRMAEHGTIAYAQQVLYRHRRTLSGISGSAWTYQKEFGRIALACRDARRSKCSETLFLKEAARLAEEARALRDDQPSARKERLRMAYLIGSQLARRGDRRAAIYLRKVISAYPFHWRAWTRLVQSYVLPFQSSVVFND